MLKTREIEISFTQRIKKVESRFSGDQESVAERFQADLLKLEQHYQSELKALSERHVEQKLHWEAQIQEALENAEEERRIMQEAMEQEKERVDQEWTKRLHEIESLHKQEMEELVMKTQQLQNELDEFISSAQSKEIALSRQLNDLHNRLQGSLETKDEHLAQSERKALETELLLNQTVEDFKQEREELLSSQSELQAKYKELLSISERQIVERIELLTERDDLRMMIEEVEMLLKRAAVDFELERKALEEHTSNLEEKLEDNRENDREELLAERDVLKIRIKELELIFNQVVSSAEKAKEEEIEESNEIHTLKEEECISFSGKNQETCLAPSVIHLTNDAMIKKDNELDEKVSDASDDQGDNMPEVNQAVAVPEDLQIGDSIPKKVEGDPEVDCCSAEIGHEDSESMSCDGLSPDVHIGNHSTVESKNEAVSPEMPCELTSSPEASEGVDADEDGENKESCERETKPPDVLTLVSEIPFREDKPCHETVVDPSVLEETDELSLADAEVGCLPNNSYYSTQEAELVSDCEHLTAKIQEDCAHDCQDEDGDWEDSQCSLLKIQALYNTATEENILLHDKISLLQQKTDILENLLAHNTEKIKTGHQILEENYSLKVKVLFLMEHVKELEAKALKTTDVQIRYEDCICENAKLKDQNGELEKTVWSLESQISVFHDFQDQQIALVDEISRLRAENSKLTKLFSEMERQGESLSAAHPGAEQSEESLLDKVQRVTDLEDSCEDFEKQNTNLRRAITELQDKSQSLNATTQAHRSPVE
ncbi:uncharacterized protein LOC142967935 [Anarhichas minor]|uniref:uncharacterized protein LOC142967935 n=1 Tax=Anarhichas minor TaxID=65739 RepID=UPI003F7374E7